MAAREPEISALEAVYSALKPLDLESRRRVLASVYSLLEMAPTMPIQQGRLSSVGLPADRASLTGQGVPVPRPVGLTELIREKGPRTNAERIVCFAYYREKYEGISRFSRNDLRDYFGRAHESPPRNYIRDFGDAVKRGWIHEDEADSYITSKGIELVESSFSTEPEAPGGTSSRRASRKPGRTKKLNRKRQKRNSQ
jgi:hypothetical protein